MLFNQSEIITNLRSILPEIASLQVYEQEAIDKFENLIGMISRSNQDQDDFDYERDVLELFKAANSVSWLREEFVTSLEYFQELSNQLNYMSSSETDSNCQEMSVHLQSLIHCLNGYFNQAKDIDSKKTFIQCHSTFSMTFDSLGNFLSQLRYDWTKKQNREKEKNLKIQNKVDHIQFLRSLSILQRLIEVFPFITQFAFYSLQLVNNIYQNNLTDL